MATRAASVAVAMALMDAADSACSSVSGLAACTAVATACISRGLSGSPRTARAASVVKNFAEIGGGIGLVIDSFGMLAICVNRGSASDELNIAVGDAVTLSALDETAGVTTSVTTNVELRRSPKGT